MQNLAKVSALKEFKQIEELVKKHDTDLQNEFQKGKKEGEDAEKEKNMQEKKEADKMNNEHMQKIQLEHIEDKQVWLCRALSCVCLTARLGHHGQ